jgi:hypothetical protein
MTNILSSFDNIPVFASDLEICQAIVGKARAVAWKKNEFPIIFRKPGFPKSDALHGGRSAPAVRQFYMDYLRLPPTPIHFNSALDDLPLFACDAEIAERLVGKKCAAGWIANTVPLLEAKMSGFPRIDPLHDGRAVTVLKIFYANYFRLPGANFVVGQGEDVEDLSKWKKSRRPSKNVWSGGTPK